MPDSFLVWPILKARAEILQKFGSFFGRFEDTKIPFWDYLTFGWQHAEFLLAKIICQMKAGQIM